MVAVGGSEKVRTHGAVSLLPNLMYYLVCLSKEVANLKHIF